MPCGLAPNRRRVIYKSYETFKKHKRYARRSRFREAGHAQRSPASESVGASFGGELSRNCSRNHLRPAISPLRFRSVVRSRSRATSAVSLFPRPAASRWATTLRCPSAYCCSSPIRPSKPAFENVPLHIESKRDNQLSFRSGAQCRRRQSRLANSVIPNAAPAYLVRKPTQQAFVSDSVLSVVQNQRSRIARNDARGSLDAVDDMK